MIMNIEELIDKNLKKNFVVTREMNAMQNANANAIQYAIYE